MVKVISTGGLPRGIRGALQAMGGCAPMPDEYGDPQPVGPTPEELQAIEAGQAPCAPGNPAAPGAAPKSPQPLPPQANSAAIAPQGQPATGATAPGPPAPPPAPKRKPPPPRGSIQRIAQQPRKLSGARLTQRPTP